jgi:glyoxylase-like metal-dependent hydrolase (beta-lactamase superfamily II)
MVSIVLSLAGALMVSQAAPTPASRAVAPVTLDVYTADSSGFSVTSTLISGPTEAILVDAQFRISDARKLADRIAASGRRLKAIFITHAHPDHYFGLSTLLERFPGTPVYMTAAALADFQRTVAGKIAQWTPVFGAEIPTAVPTPQVVPTSRFTVDSEVVEVIPDLQGDAATSTNSAVWVPALRALIAGDLVYHEVHVWLAESKPETRRAWQASLRQLAGRRASVVVAGHKRLPELADTPAAIDFTSRYIADFETARAASRNAEDLIAAMQRKYPHAGLPIALTFAAKAAFP